MLTVYEVWKYNVEQYDVTKKSGGLFTEMMYKFVKLKQEASGWPGNCDSEEQQNAYIENFFEKEGIRLDPFRISKNPGLKSLAKLILNSFWGKFVQRENLPKTSVIRQPCELEELMSDPSISLNHVEIVTENTVVANWKRLDEAVDPLPTINVVIAAYTTAQARLKLYSYLEGLQQKTLYYDTDSVICVHKKDQWEVPVGSSLGEMTDELEMYGPDSYIVAITFRGPKNYSCIVFSPKYHTYYSSSSFSTVS